MPGHGRCLTINHLFESLAAVACLLIAPPALAQLEPSHCADCHFANQGKPDPVHLLEWDASPHHRADVGCDKCHGGNPTTFEPFLAHQSIVRGRGPETPLHPTNLAKTCGSCHHGPYAQFQKSRHAALLAQQIYAGPTCSTCHGYAAGYTLSPSSLEKQCNSCHGHGKKAARPEYAANARAWLGDVTDIRLLLDGARSIVKRIRNPQLRASLEHDAQQAEVPLIEAVQDGHAFIFVDARERLTVSRSRTEALLSRLVHDIP